jgi:lipopolysaccharide/colanic/teichoic acid biosynthesis glycosyltransferase
MEAAADRNGSLTVRNDSRVTRVGEYLRRYKLDELPQLFNVVLGDMSLVGPRPEVPEFVKFYTTEDKAIVLSVRPGITDNASIAFRNESSLLDHAVDPKVRYVQEILPIKLAFYRDYVENHTLLTDISILFKTLRTIW